MLFFIINLNLNFKWKIKLQLILKKKKILLFLNKKFLICKLIYLQYFL